jgi:hypothetical protein
VCAFGLLLLNDPEQVQDINRYDGIANKGCGRSGGQELIDSPKDERSGEKQAFQQRMEVRSQSNLQ